MDLRQDRRAAVTEVLEVITAEDVIRGGACREGVYGWLSSHPSAPVALPVAVALRMSSRDERVHIEAAAGMRGDGYGDGYGYGDGDGYGDGYGDGDGYGYGYGYGYGDGYGDGYGED